MFHDSDNEQTGSKLEAQVRLKLSKDHPFVRDILQLFSSIHIPEPLVSFNDRIRTVNLVWNKSAALAIDFEFNEFVFSYIEDNRIGVVVFGFNEKSDCGYRIKEFLLK